MASEFYDANPDDPAANWIEPRLDEWRAEDREVWRQQHLREVADAESSMAEALAAMKELDSLSPATPEWQRIVEGALDRARRLQAILAGQPTRMDLSLDALALLHGAPVLCVPLEWYSALLRSTRLLQLVESGELIASEEALTFACRCYMSLHASRRFSVDCLERPFRNPLSAMNSLGTVDCLGRQLICQGIRFYGDFNAARDRAIILAHIAAESAPSREVFVREKMGRLRVPVMWIRPRDRPRADPDAPATG